MIESLKRLGRHIIFANRLAMYWDKGTNWGDALNPVLVEHLSRKKVRFAAGPERNKYMAIGSILQKADGRTEVWGSGLIADDVEPNAPPRVIHAVRGPLTRQRLLEMGISCPEVYGDPALLLPYFYNPPTEKQYTLGIVPHYIDKGHSWLHQARASNGVRVIDVEGGVHSFVDEIKSCERVVSSSLHGIICADAFGIPSGWIRFSDRVTGGDFKFRDYYASTGNDAPEVLDVREGATLADLMNHASPRPLQIDLRKLVDACPFVHDNVRTNLTASITKKDRVVL